MIIFAFCLTIMIFSYNIFFSFDNGYRKIENNTETIICNQPKSNNWKILNAWSMVN